MSNDAEATQLSGNIKDVVTGLWGLVLEGYEKGRVDAVMGALCRATIHTAGELPLAIDMESRNVAALKIVINTWMIEAYLGSQHEANPATGKPPREVMDLTYTTLNDLTKKVEDVGKLVDFLAKHK